MKFILSSYKTKMSYWNVIQHVVEFHTAV